MLGLLSGLMLVGVLLILAVIRHHRILARWDGSGSASEGVIVFVEPVHWLFVVWGFLPFARGLRRAGCRHQLRLFRWSRKAGAVLVLPDLVRQERLLAKAGRLARFIEEIAAELPGRPIHLCGYSSGCYLIAEAVKSLSASGSLGRVVFLAATTSPQYDLGPLAARAQGVYNFYSRLDGWINGLGPWLFGCNDRRHCLAAGMVGFKSPPVGVQQYGWSLKDVRLGYWGGHFTIASSRFVAERIAPLFLAVRTAA